MAPNSVTLSNITLVLGFFLCVYIYVYIYIYVCVYLYIYTLFFLEKWNQKVEDLSMPINLHLLHHF